MANQEHPPANTPFIVVADHPALDILNTLPQVDGAPRDLWQTDQDVLDWLRQTGWAAEINPSKLKPRALLQAARTLRETIRTLVERRKTGKRVDPEILNAFLDEARSYLELISPKDGNLQLVRRWKQRSAEESLAPLAESAADLLVHGDFDLIRRCESEDCVLWFYDRTKSHHRRWCSMATCGNRHKVAEYRKRRRVS